MSYSEQQKRALGFIMGIKQLEMIWEVTIDHSYDMCSILYDSKTKDTLGILTDESELDFDLDFDDH